MGLNRVDPRYTGSLYSDFTAIGYRAVPLSQRSRGDILLNSRHHVIMYLGNGRVGGARIDERGKIAGGRPGDNTGREVCIHAYYNYPWNYCLRPPTSAMASWTAARMEWYCQNDQYGYNQANRWGSTACDCSSLCYRVVYDYEDAGHPTGSGSGSGLYTPTYIDEDGSGGHNTMFLFEYTMGLRGESRENAVMSGQDRSDDKYRPAWTPSVEHAAGGSEATRRLQRVLGIDADGYWGYTTSGALQERLKSFGHKLDVDHSFGPRSMEVFQWALNHGQIAPTWLYGSKGWWYADGNGGYATGWRRINGKWYYFDQNGWMKTGWIYTDGNWYYLAVDGDMCTGWIKSNGKWYYLNDSGAMLAGTTQLVDGKSYTFDMNGAMA